MYLGKILQLAPTGEPYASPRHPYTRALLCAVPVPEPKHKEELIVLTGEVPSPINPPSGCGFRTRCFMVHEIYSHQEPALRDIIPNHFTVCHFV
jgi:oligopeptide/dipeptide ABC transporter ATP-binding protein